MVPGVELFVRVLGPLEVWRGGAMVPIGGPKARITLGVLLAHRQSVVSVDRLADALWGDVPPESAVATIQSNISRLRKTLAPEVEILARAPGYLLEAPPDRIDATRFAGLVRDATTAAMPAEVVELLGTALALWRGPAFGEFAHLDWARGDAVQLDELRLVAVETLLEARLALGEAGAVVGELERLVVDHPLRERFWRQLMVALYRTGRQGEALRQANQLRAFLGDELGLDLSPAARELEARILADDPTLLRRRAAAGASPWRGPPAPAADATRFVRPGRRRRRGSAPPRHRSPRDARRSRRRREDPPRVAAGRRCTRRPAGLEPCIVELAATHDQPAAVQAIATALDVQQRQHLTLDATLVDFLRDRDVLIVLDNCEHLVETLAPFVDRIRTSCPGVTVLATSREPLGLAGERTWQLGPLGLPDVDARSPRSDRDLGGGAAVRRPRGRRRRPGSPSPPTTPPRSRRSAAASTACRSRSSSRRRVCARSARPRSPSGCGSTRTSSARRSGAPTAATGRCATRSNGRTGS